MDLGQEIVSSALREGTLQPFLAAGITTTWLSNQEDPTPADIFQGQHREAYQSLLKHWDRHGKVMSVDLFRLSYPETAYRLSDNNHTPEELLEIFREDRRKYLTAMASTDILEVCKEERHDEAMQLLAAHEAAMAALKGAADKPYRLVTLAELDALPELRASDRGRGRSRHGHHAGRVIRYRQELPRSRLGAVPRIRYPVDGP